MKKILSILTAGLMILSLSACGGEQKNEKLELLAEAWDGEKDVMISVDFFYPKDKGITVEGDDESPNQKDIHYTEKNITISPALFEDMTFDDNKKYDKENQETYKEFKIGKYDCYGYEDFGGYWIYVHLEEVSESTDRYLVIDTETIDFSKDSVEGIKQYEDEDVKKIIESFVYNGVVEKPEETEQAQ